MEFNNDPEWLRLHAAAEEGCDVSVGTPVCPGLAPEQLLNELLVATNANFRMLATKIPMPGPEASHECTCGCCRQPYTSTLPNWAGVGYCDPCIAIMAAEMQAFYDAESKPAHSEVNSHIYCCICQECMTCNLRPCRDGGAHQVERRHTRTT